MSERVMPHSLDAEKSILGAILLHEDALLEVADRLTEREFFRDAHQRIFRAMLALQERRVAIDLTTLREQLMKTGDFNEVGGATYIASLIDGAPRVKNVSSYAAIVRAKASLRQLVTAGQRLVAKAYDASEDAGEILEDAERSILGLAEGHVTAGFEPMRAIAMRGLDAIEQAHQRRQVVIGVPSGLTDLDQITRGFLPAKLIVVGARPGVGKSSLALNLVALHAATHGYVVAGCSLEMEKIDLFMRQVAALAHIDSHCLQTGYLGDSEWARISQAVGAIAESTLFLDDTPAISLFAIRSRLRRLKAEHGLDLVVIDYLQLMSMPREHDTRALAVGAVTAGLKSLAKELQVPIILLSQLSRESVKGDSVRRPRLSDLKDSGSIEQDADIVIFIHKAEDPEQTADGGVVAELIVAKHRGGPVGTVKVGWFERQTRFGDFVTEAEDQRLPMGDR
jgi:replicative DNA helicase